MRQVWAAMLLAGAAVPAGAQGVAPGAETAGMLPGGTRLDVVAEGRVTRVPDVARVNAGVVTQASTASAALQGNAERMARVVAALRRAGVAERDIQTSQISLQPEYRYAEGQAPQLTGYQATNSVAVRFRDLRNAGRILDALVAAGANQIGGPTLEIDRPEAALDEARVAAIRHARARADLYARAIGKRVGRILLISEGGGGYRPQPVPAGAMARLQADGAAVEIAPGEQELTVQVQVSFSLE